MGGSGGAGVSGDISTSLNGDTSDYNAWSIVLPPLAFTPPMAAVVGCAPQIVQKTVGIGFGLFSQADGVTDVSNCTLMALRNVKVDSCQYGSAQQIEDLLTKKLLPEYVPSAIRFPDLTPTQCHALKTPVPPPQVVNYIAPPPVVPPVVVPPVVVPEPVKPKPKKKPPCPAGQQLVCKG